MKARLHAALAAAAHALVSAQARRYEVALVLIAYEAIRKALGHP